MLALISELVTLLIILWGAPFLAVGQSFNLQQFGEVEGLPSLDIYEAIQNSKGYIWLGTESGAVRYNGYDFIPAKLGDKLNHSDVIGIMEDSSGRVWFRTISGQVCYRENDLYYTPENSKLCQQLSFSSMVLKIFEKDGQIIFVSNDHGTKILTEGEIKAFPSKAIKNAFLTPEGVMLIDHYGLILQDLDGNIDTIDHVERHLAFATGLYHNQEYLVSGGRYITSFKAGYTDLDTLFDSGSMENEVINIQALDEQTLVISTRKGAVFIDQKQKRVFREELTGIPVSSVLKDKNGGLWYTTLGQGLFYDQNPDNRPFQLLKTEVPGPAFDLYKDSQSNIWVGCDANKVVVWARDTIYQFQLLTESKGRADRITSIKEDPDGKVIVLGKCVIARISDLKDIEINIGSGNDFIIDQKGILWTGSLKTNRVGKYTREIHSRGDKRRPKLRKRTHCFAHYKNSFLVGTNAGLYFCDQETLDFQLVDDTEDHSIVDISLPYLLTQRGKLLTIDDFSVSNFETHPIMDARSHCLQEVANWFYIGTNKGLFRLNKTNGDLIKESAVGDIKIFDLETRGDSLLIGSEKGLLSMGIRLGDEVLPSPHLFLDSVLVNGRRQNLEQIQNLSYQENAIKICYTGLLFPQSPTYQYRINQEQWIQVNARELNLQLAPGDYTITIQALNGNQTGSDIIEIPLHISQPFWKSWEFFFLIGFSLLTILGAGLYRYLRKIRKGHKEQRESDLAKLKIAHVKNRILELEQQALRLQMNPHFLFNSINSIKGLYAQGKIKEAITYIHHFSNFLRVIVNNEKPLVSIQEEVKILNHYLSLEKMKFPLINFKIELGPDIEPERMQIPFMMIQPFIENSILHGLGPKKDGGTIWVKIYKSSPKMISIEIEDDGMGLSDKKNTPKKTSMGIKITSERLSMFNDPDPIEIKIRNRSDAQGVNVSFQTRFVYE